MSAIVLLVELRINPGQMDAFLARARAHRGNVTAKEPGCLGFDILVPEEDGATVYLHEVYADDAALQTHFNTSYMKAYLNDTAPMIAQRTRRQCRLANE